MGYDSLLCNQIPGPIAMTFLYELLPLLVFFTMFKIAGIYVATAALIVVTVAQLAIDWWRTRTVKKMPLITAALALVLGGLTLAFHDPAFIKWKFSVVYWLLGFSFLVSQFLGKRPLTARMLEEKIALPDLVWRRLNQLWSAFFILLGFVNVYVIYHFSTAAWVNFKVFGVLGATVVFVLLQAAYIARHLPAEESS